jgi:hypothetical protein
MELSEKALNLVMEIWREQALYLGLPGPEEGTLEDWLNNRTYDLSLLEATAAGDTEALLRVRLEAGLSPFV